MTTDHALYYGTTLIAPNGTHTLGAVTGAFTTHLLDFDWGTAPKETREDERPNDDGTFRRGAYFRPRDFYHSIGIRVDVAKFASTAIEGARDDAVESIVNLILGDGSTQAVKQTRKDNAGNAVSRLIYAEPTVIPAPKWSKTDWAEGLVGNFAQPDAVVAINWHAQFPWFLDTVATATTSLTLDGTERSETITNPCKRPIPLLLSMLGAGSGLTIVVWNATTGAAAATVGIGVTLADVTLSATNPTVVDQYVTDPQRFQAYQGAGGTTDIRSKLAARPRVWLQPGANTIKRQVTAGSPTGATLVASYRARWGTP